MGQRHQLFLVARVRAAPGEPDQYRCVAAFHHQWCYGKLPLHCVSRLKHLAATKANAALIQRDLDGYRDGVQRSKRVPCPYISFLAGTAFSVDIEGEGPWKYFSDIHYQSATMGSTGGDNNNGITVVDITDPVDLAYCFVSIGGDMEAEGYAEVPNRVPLTATQYLRAYYPESLDPLASQSEQEAEEVDQKAIDDLDDIRLLTLDVLAAVWPHEYRPEIDGDESSTDASTDCEDPKPSTSIDPSVARAAAGDVTVDLSKRCLSSAEIFATLKEAGPFSRLDISHNPAVGKAVLTQLFQEHRFEWVNIDGCSISNEDMVDLLKSQPSLFRGVEAIIHPVFLSANSLRDEGNSKGMPVAFSLLYKARFRTDRCVLPFFGVDQLVQNLLDVARALMVLEFIGNTPSSRNMLSLFAASYRSGRPWATRDIQCIPLQTTSGDLTEGYTLVVLPQRMLNPIPSPRGGMLFQYGIIPPGGERKFIDVATFLDCLKEGGWPEPKDEKAVEQVIKAYNEGGSLLADFQDVMNALN